MFLLLPITLRKQDLIDDTWYKWTITWKPLLTLIQDTIKTQAGSLSGFLNGKKLKRRMQIAKWRWPVVLWLHCTGHFRSSRPYSRWLLLLIVPLAYTVLCYSLLWHYNPCNKFWRIRLPLLHLEIFCHSCRNRKHKSSLPCSFHSHPNPSMSCTCSTWDHTLWNRRTSPSQC